MGWVNGIVAESALQEMRKVALIQQRYRVTGKENFSTTTKVQPLCDHQEVGEDLSRGRRGWERSENVLRDTYIIGTTYSTSYVFSLWCLGICSVTSVVNSGILLSASQSQPVWTSWYANSRFSEGRSNWAEFFRFSWRKRLSTIPCRKL